MPIRVKCQCGKQLAVKDELAGKRVKCPKCGGPLPIPQPQAAAGENDDGISDLLDDVGMRAGVARCPGCGAEMSENAVFCVMCGFDLRRGHRVKTRVGDATEMDDEDLGDLPAHGNPQLDEAERRLARAKKEEKQLTQGVPWWMILLAFAGVVGFTAGMVAMPQDLVVRNAGWVLVVAGALLTFFFTLRLLIEAFKESPLQGLLGLTLVYLIVFAVMRWDRLGPMLIFSLVGGAFIGFGYVMVVFLVPFFEGLIEAEEKEDLTLRFQIERPAVVLHVEGRKRGQDPFCCPFS